MRKHPQLEYAASSSDVEFS